MEFDAVKNYILDRLNPFIYNNKMEHLKEKNYGGYGFSICRGNAENYFCIYYGFHIYQYDYEIVVKFGKRAFVKDKDLDYIFEKPCYTINDFYKDLVLQIDVDFIKDKKTIDKVCDVIPIIFEELTNQSDAQFIERCSK